MSEVFLKLLNMSIAASWLILAVVIIRPFIKKAPKWINCVLWALVALRLVCPFSFESALSLIPSSEAIPYDIAMQNTPTIDTGISAVNRAVNPMIANNYTPDPFTSANPLQILVPVATAVWMIGMGALMLYALVSYIKLKKSVVASITVKDNIMACDEVKSPFILGIMHPVIYVPSSMTGETLICVINHEMAHIKRCDYFWKPLGYFLLMVYWFNPLCWLAYALLCRDIEMACDEKVIRDMDRNEKAAYSQALLNCNFPRKRIAACPLAFGEIGVKERVKLVLGYKKPAFGVIIVALVGCIVFAVCFLTNPMHDTYSLRVVIPAGNTEQICYSEEQFSPRGNRIIISAGDGIENAEISIKQVEVRTETTYDESYLLNSSNEVKLEIEKGGWFQLGVSMHNPTDEDMVVYVLIENVTVRNVDVASDPPHNAMKAIVTGIDNGSMIVTPVEGSWELNSSDLFRIPIKNMETSPEPQVGDMIEVEYDGGISETYPASLENIIYISVVEQCGVGYDICPCVMINGTLYFDTGYESTGDGRCGNMDGTIDSECSPAEVPTVNNQGNFGSGYGYQYGPLEGTIDIQFESGEWRVFAIKEVKETYRDAVAKIESNPESSNLIGPWFLDEDITILSNNGIELQAIIGKSEADSPCTLVVKADGLIEFTLGSYKGEGKWQPDGDTGRYVADVFLSNDGGDVSLPFYIFREGPDSPTYLVLEYEDVIFFWSKE